MSVSLVMGIIAAGASIIGGAVKSHNAYRAEQRQQNEIDRQRSENTNWYNKRYYEDATQRADNQRLITQARAALQRNNMAASGQSAVMGATNATSAAMKEANNNALANTVSGVAASAAQSKDRVEQTYMQRDAQLGNMQTQADMTAMEANNAAIDGAVGGVNALASSYIAGSKEQAAINATKAVNDAKSQNVPVGNVKPTAQSVNATNAAKVSNNTARSAKYGWIFD